MYGSKSMTVESEKLFIEEATCLLFIVHGFRDTRPLRDVLFRPEASCDLCFS